MGLGTFLHQGRRSSGTAHSDSETFHLLLRQHDLHALTTWTPNLGPTFQHQDVVSRLDYICCPRWHSDRTARDVHYLTYSCVKSIALEMEPSAEAATLSAFSCPRSRIQRLQHDDHILPSLHHTLQSCSIGSCPTPKLKPSHRLDPTPFQAFRFHGGALRTLTDVTCANLFTAWFHLTKLIQARKQMNATARAARKAMLQTVFDQADEAERASDHFRLYQAPKQSASRVQLRNPNGTITSLSQAADLLSTWYENMYKATGCMPATFISQVLNWPFTVQEFCWGLQRLPLMKSLAPSYVPALFWNLGSWDVAHFLQPSCVEWSQTGVYPQAWGQGHLTFLPKTGEARTRLQI